MAKLFPQIAFAVVMLALGVVALFFADEICSNALRVIGERRVLFNMVNSTQIKWSIRFGGAIAILIGVFVLWMSWRNY